MQRSWHKNANPKPAGFAGCPNPGFGFGKMSGFPRAPGFSKPGFQSLLRCLFLPSCSPDSDCIFCCITSCVVRRFNTVSKRLLLSQYFCCSVSRAELVLDKALVFVLFLQSCQQNSVVASLYSAVREQRT